MAVWKMTDKRRRLPWRAKVRGTVKDFLTKKDAELWEREQHRSYTLTGLPLTIEALQKVTVGEIVARYLKDKTPLKGSAVSETTVLERLLGFKKGVRDPKRKQHPMCALSLAAINETDACAYRDERLKDTWRNKPISPTTVRREINTLHRIFAIGRKEWGYKNLPNPFDKLEIKNDEHGRERRLEKGEYERLIDACEQCRGLNCLYIPLAIRLAVETGMRLQEIFYLTWADVDIEGRRIVIRKSKTDHVSKYKGRTIVMSINARTVLAWLSLKLRWNAKQPKLNRESLIFPMTKDAFKQSWSDVVDRAKIVDLHFHDLRHEAGSRFAEAGLINPEHMLMMGHRKRTMTERYSHVKELQSIQDKLDRHQFNGETWAEVEENIKTTEQAALFKTATEDMIATWVKALEAGEQITLKEAGQRTGRYYQQQAKLELERREAIDDSENVLAFARAEKQLAIAGKKKGA
jgi:integrase